MDILCAAIVVILFAVLLHVLGIVRRTKEVVAIGQQASATLRSHDLSDLQKEQRMRQNSLQLFRLLSILVAGTGIALGAPLAGIWLFQHAGLFSLEGVLAAFLRWDFMIGATVLGIVAYLASVRWLHRPS